jgi:uncharacterized membrane protein (UPF0136 family)
MSNAVLYVHLAFGLLLFWMIWAAKVRQMRGVAITSALLLLVTGAFNFMTKMKGAPAGWHALIGIKLLLALHVIGMVFLIARGTATAEKEARWRKGALMTGAVVMLIGLYYSNLAR